MKKINQNYKRTEKINEKQPPLPPPCRRQVEAPPPHPTPPHEGSTAPYSLNLIAPTELTNHAVASISEIVNRKEAAMTT